MAAGAAGGGPGSNSSKHQRRAAAPTFSTFTDKGEVLEVFAPEMLQLGAAGAGGAAGARPGQKGGPRKGPEPMPAGKHTVRLRLTESSLGDACSTVRCLCGAGLQPAIVCLLPWHEQPQRNRPHGNRQLASPRPHPSLPHWRRTSSLLARSFSRSYLGTRRPSRSQRSARESSPPRRPRLPLLVEGSGSATVEEGRRRLLRTTPPLRSSSLASAPGAGQWPWRRPTRCGMKHSSSPASGCTAFMPHGHEQLKDTPSLLMCARRSATFGRSSSSRRSWTACTARRRWRCSTQPSPRGRRSRRATWSCGCTPAATRRARRSMRWRHTRSSGPQRRWGHA